MARTIQCRCGHNVSLDGGLSTVTGCPNCGRQLKIPPPPPRTGTTGQSKKATSRGPSLGLQTQQPRQRWKPREGLAPDSQYRGTVIGFAIALVVLSLVEMVPAAVSIIKNSQLDEPESLHHWVYLLLFVGTIQLAYSLFLWQLPDFSSLWAVTLVSLAVATMHAFLFAIRVIANENHSIIASLQLNLETLSPGKQAGWCMVILILFGTYCYFAGRTALAWQQRFKTR